MYLAQSLFSCLSIQVLILMNLQIYSFFGKTVAWAATTKTKVRRYCYRRTSLSGKRDSDPRPQISKNQSNTNKPQKSCHKYRQDSHKSKHKDAREERSRASLISQRIKPPIPHFLGDGILPYIKYLFCLVFGCWSHEVVVKPLKLVIIHPLFLLHGAKASELLLNR